MVPKSNTQWIAERFASMEPEWSPNLARGRSLLNAKLTRRRFSSAWLAVPVAAAAVCCAVLAIPTTRALAEDLWYRYALDRVNVVLLDFSKSPIHTQVVTNGLEQQVPNLEEAQAKAGFLPYLPSPHVLPGIPEITVTGSIFVEQTIHINEIQSALDREGVSDVQVPEQWNGLQLHTSIGPIVEASYSGDVQIQQERPIELFVSPGLPLQPFADVVFRSMGVPAWKAKVMARQFADHPAWIMDVPPDAVVSIHDLVLSTGPAFLLEEFDSRGAVKRATVIRCTDDRIYSVSSRSSELSTRIADALP